MTAPIKMAKRAAAGTLALAVCLTGGVLGAGAAQAASGFEFDQRLGGADRFETAVNASKEAFDNAGDVIVVQDAALADGLTASYLAGVKKAPILYVRQNEVPAVTAAEITRLGAERIFIVGGSAVVSNGVQTSLGSDGRTVTRIGGTDRFDTAAKVATSNGNDVDTVFIANGDAPADALAAGPIAYKSNNPILLTRSDVVPPQTAAALNQLQETSRIALGGNAVVSTSTYSDLGATSRLSGQDRQGTAVAIADYAVANEGFTRANAALVGSEDRNTADALIAAPLLGQTGTPILFTTRGGLGVTSKNYLTENVGELTGTGYVFGGNAAVPQSVADEATQAAGGTPAPPTTPPPSTSSIAVTPADAITQSLATETAQTQRDDNRVYQANGLKDGVEYRITLVDSDSIRTANGVTTFRSSSDTESDSGYSVDVGTRFASVISVNGSNVTPDATADTAAGFIGVRTITAVPVNGVISFEIDGDRVGSVTPVVYVNGAPGRSSANGGPSIRLETSAKAAGEFAAVTEPFGLAGQVTYVGQLGAAGPIPNGSIVASVNKDSNTFSTDAIANGAASARYTYDDNDTFQLSGQAVDLATFEAQLSSGDGIAGTFVQGASGNSTFNLTDTNPQAITNVTATRSGTTTSSVTVEGTFVGNLREIDSFVVQRAAVGNGTTNMAQVGDYTTVATVPATDTNAATNNVQLRYVDTNVPDGSYQYRVAAINDGDQGPFAVSAERVGSSASATTVVDTRLTAGGNNTNAFVLGTDDSFTIVTSKPVVLSNTPQLRISDGDGSVRDFVGGGANANFALNTGDVTIGGTVYPARRVITVSLVNDGTNQSPNQQQGITSLGFPATLTDSAGITDENGTKIALTGDVTIENDASGQTDVTAPTVTANGVAAPADNAPAGAQTVTVTFSEPVRLEAGGTAATAAAGFSYDPDGGGTTAASNGTGVTFNGDGTVASVTFTTTGVVVATADTLAYTAPPAPNRITDATGNPVASFTARGTTN